MAKVFISYKTDDLDVATRVKEVIDAQYDFTSYLDRIDDALLGDGPGLAEHLLKRIDECDQLLAVVGPATKGSWWVPWEIGVCSEKHYFLATFCQRYVSLPSYLSKWPVLRSEADIDQYCQQSRKERRSLEIATARTVYLSERETARRSSADAFHRNLRRVLGQA